jgi:hypothetical protein
LFQEYDRLAGILAGQLIDHRTGGLGIASGRAQKSFEHDQAAG